MSNRGIGEFKVRGFVIGIALCLSLAWALYYELSSRIEPPKQQEASATVDFLLKRSQELEKQATADRRRIEQLEKEVEILKTRRDSPKAGGRRQEKHHQ